MSSNYVQDICSVLLLKEKCCNNQQEVFLLHSCECPLVLHCTNHPYICSQVEYPTSPRIPFCCLCSSKSQLEFYPILGSYDSKMIFSEHRSCYAKASS